jgi:3-hydroxy-D-aspartate aldolase
MAMTNPNFALLGKPNGRLQIATPALVVDHAAFERNLAAMQEHCNRVGLKLRPHAKTHKSVSVAKRQIAAGAVGQCCAKLGEAEVLAEGGIDSILVTSPIVAAQAFARVGALNGRMKDLMVTVDSEAGVDGFARVARETKKPLKIIVDIDIGLHRTGIAPGEPALRLAQRAKAAGLTFMGLQGYAGQLQHIAGFEERKAKSLEAMKMLRDTRDLLVKNELPCPIVSGGGTGTFNIDAEARVFTELQAGSYIFMDKQYHEVTIANGAPMPFETSLFVQTTVISNNTAGLVTTDAGFKAFATDAGPPLLQFGAPEGASYFFFGDEQGGIFTTTKMELGSVVVCNAPHCDPTVNLYDFYHVVEGDALIDIWPIEARGRSA